MCFDYDSIKNILYGNQDNAGYYSCINQTKLGLYSLISKSIIPEKISFENTLKPYKENPNNDIFDLIYKIDHSNIKNLNTNFHYENFDVNYIDYDNIDFENFKKINDVFFNPSDLVLERISFLENKYNIDYENTLCVFHRGNDKHWEVKPIPLDVWVKVAKDFGENYRILVQTDSLDAKDFFVKNLSNTFIFEEMLFENVGGNVKPSIDKTNWIINFESVVRIVSKCKMLLTHHGNCGFAAVMFRGNTENVVQMQKYA